MNTKRIVLSLGTLVFAAAVVAGGTGAFFSATETAEGNVFTAGTVSLDMGTIAHEYFGDDSNAPIFTTPGGTSFDLDDLKPLDWGEITFELENGANEAYVCAMVTNDPDDGVDAASLALYDLLNFYQDDGNQVVPGQWFSLGAVDANTPVGTGVDYCFGDSQVDGTGLTACEHGGLDYNPAQGGSFEADLMFYAIQTRNNGDFSCDQLTMGDEGWEYIPDESGDEPVVNDGELDFADVAGARLRSFGNTGGREIYAGEGDLGVGANRNDAEYTWTGSHTMAVSYDAAASEVSVTVDDTTTVTRADGLTCDPDALQFSIVARDSGTTVELNDLDLGGNALGSYSVSQGDTSEWVTWNVTGFDFSNDFTLSGDLELIGAFGSSQELSKVDVNFGCEA